MHIKSKTLWLQKDGNAAEDYEDAAYPTEGVDSDVESFRCAIADGATESSFAGLWASILCEGLVYGSDLTVLRDDFVAKMGTKVLPWYAEEKLQSGAFAAVVTLSLKEDEEEFNLCDLKAIGDSCVMHTRDDKLLASFPIDRPESFNNSPNLLCSSHSNDAEDKFQEQQLVWLKGDTFWLMTDALACWALRRLRDYDDAFQILGQIEDLSALKDFVHEHRAIIDEDGRPCLKNDDVTLIRIVTA